jgi:hypothetical protein
MGAVRPVQEGGEWVDAPYVELTASCDSVQPTLAAVELYRLHCLLTDTKIDASIEAQLPSSSVFEISLSRVRTCGKALEPLAACLSVAACELHGLSMHMGLLDECHLGRLMRNLPHKSPLKSLRLVSQRLFSGALGALLEAGERGVMPHLETLDLSHNPIGEGVDAVADHFGELPKGRGGWQLTALVLADTMMGDGGLAALAASVERATVLASLDLRWNHDASDAAKQRVSAAWLATRKEQEKLLLLRSDM